MRVGVLAVLAAVAVIADATLAPEIEILGARPDFLVLVVVYASLLVGTRPATIAGFLVGLVADSELPEYLGLHALALSAVGYITGGVWDHLVRGNVLVQCTLVFGASLLHDVIYYLVYYRNHLEMLGPFLLRYGVPGALYTAVFGGVVFALARLAGWRSIAHDA
jgi:rod shape-determining protein MreD